MIDGKEQKNEGGLIIRPKQKNTVKSLVTMQTKYMCRDSFTTKRYRLYPSKAKAF